MIRRRARPWDFENKEYPFDNNRNKQTKIDDTQRSYTFLDPRPYQEPAPPVPPRKRSKLRQFQKKRSTGGLLQPNLEMFGFSGTGQHQMEPQVYDPRLLLDLPDGIFFEMIRHMTVDNIRAVCNTIPGMKNKCRREMELGRLKTRAEINFYVYVQDEDGEAFDSSDPVTLTVDIKWGSPEELVAKLDAFQFFANNHFAPEYDHSGWFDGNELWDGSVSLETLKETIGEYTLDDLTSGEFMIEKIKYLKYNDLELPENFDPDQEEGWWWYEKYIPESTFNDLAPWSGWTLWDIEPDFQAKQEKGNQLYFDLEKIMSEDYQTNKQARDQVLRSLRDKPGITSQTLDLIYKFAGIDDPDEPQGPIRDGLFF